VSLLIQKSTIKNFVGADSEIGGKIASLSIQKLAAKNYVAADSEIDSDGGVILGFTSLFFGCLHSPLLI
jgi:hypothetical protein